MSVVLCNGTCHYLSECRTLGQSSHSIVTPVYIQNVIQHLQHYIERIAFIVGNQDECIGSGTVEQE